MFYYLIQEVILTDIIVRKFVKDGSKVYLVNRLYGFLLGSPLFGYGIFVMWLLAFHMGLSEPIDPEKVKSQPK